MVTGPGVAPLAAAIAAAGRGWHVFPLRPGDKRPAFPDHDADHCTRRDPRCQAGHVGWEDRATVDADRIRRGWSTGRRYNVGIAAGPSGLLVIDLDTPKPDQLPPPAEWAAVGAGCGLEVLAVLAERAAEPFPGETFTVATGRGGRHLYFTMPAGARLGNTSGKRGGGLGWLIDTRGFGGYVVAAGSTVAGRPYTVTDDRPPAPLPPWLFQRLTPPPPRPARRAGRATAPASTRRTTAYLDAVVRHETDLVAAAEAGAHNWTLYTAALVLGQFAAAGAFSTEHAADLLEQAAAGHITGPCDCHRSGVAATIRSGLRAGARNPRTVPA
ncbi:bifunctional DNA primase/polymerase [Pseudofrankia asymbiotica]|uniref:DNA primase/polymerase bifunctional N-terminal domain-containing protein n=1 Tax=Pseudofrankia asymbiotica TaxID=1834516 RepID=A0A1V2I2A4_9ACTN|nr:bifunctional DNA primase/polymerase [Pseudofrankia asymbiotica]ONH23837.1 hypothetical protein BL253_31975 [Pseudofrankia asymbiotica]